MAGQLPGLFRECVFISILTRGSARALFEILRKNKLDQLGRVGIQAPQTTMNCRHERSHSSRRSTNCSYNITSFAEQWQGDLTAAW